MTEEVTEKTINYLTEIAMESKMSFDVNWDDINLSKEEVFKKTATSVLNELTSIPEDTRGAVASASLTRLLVENLILTRLLKRYETKNSV